MEPLGSVTRTSLEEEISKEVDAMEKNPQDLTPMKGLLKHTSLYVYYQGGKGVVSDFMDHQLCHLCETSRQRDPGQSEEKAFRFRIQVCMLRLLSVENKGRVATWRSNLAKQIQDCAECYQGFLRAKRQFRAHFLSTYSQSSIDKFFDFMLEWELEKTTELLKKSRLIPEPGFEDDPCLLTGAQAYMALELAGILASKGRWQGLYEDIRRNRHKLPIPALVEVPSGLLALAMDDDDEVRRWAQKERSVPIMSRELSTNMPTVGLLVRHAIERNRWDAFKFALKVAPESFTGSALPNTLLAHLSDRTTQTASILRCVQSLLDLKGHSLWSAEDGQYPLVVLASILDSKHFMTCVSDGTGATDLFDWITPFVTSLHQPSRHSRKSSTSDEKESSDSDSNHARTATYAERLASDAVVFEEAVKRIAYFLLEKCQQGHLPLTSRVAAIAECMRFLVEILSVGKPGQSIDEEDDSEEGRERGESQKLRNHAILAQVTALHSGAISSLAFRGKLPNSSDVVTIDVDARARTRHLISTLFRFDCKSMRSGLLLLSERAARRQHSYKRQVKKASSDKDAVRNEFERAAEDVVVSAIVCVELWKDGYVACRPLQDINMFLEPLAQLSPYSEPSLYSCLISASKEHEDMPAFAIYKDRLKATLSGFARQLRAMRGSLANTLLDLSDVPISSNQSAASNLTTVCHGVAYGIISAQLCADDDIHKAAQNVIRAAFEDAETRADCFRTLFQSNPDAALRGIDHFLQYFVVAASGLIEASNAAKWMVRSFSDIVEVFCSETDGLLRPGTPFSLVSSDKPSSNLQARILSIWSRMCRSIAIIFKRTPGWSRVLQATELTSWFRDVTIFASDLATHVSLFQDVISPMTAGEESSAGRQDVLAQLLDPLQEVLSWFRINNIEIVHETYDYLILGLRCFRKYGDDGDGHGSSIPPSVKERLLAFIDSQMKVESAEERNTLLTLPELARLRLFVEGPAKIDVIEVGSSDESLQQGSDSSRAQKPSSSENTSRSNPKASTYKTSLDQRRDLSRTSTGERDQNGSSKTSVDGERAAHLKQQRLMFEKIDAQAAQRKPFVSRLAPVPPPPRLAVPAGAANRYQSAASRPAAATSSTSSTSAQRAASTKMGQLKQDFRATHTVFKPNNTTRRNGTSAVRLAEMPAPQAPEAKRSFASAPLQNRSSTAQADAVGVASSASEDDSSSEDGEGKKVGLAALTNKHGTSRKLGSKQRSIAKLNEPPRRAILLKDHDARRAEREREEMIRKQRLRDPPNYGPLHKAILLWDFHAGGDLPPDMPRPEPIKTSYANAEEYVKTFEPMLLLECWSEVSEAREQVQQRSSDHTAYPATITARSHADAFDLLHVTLQQIGGRDKVWFNEADLLFIREKGLTSGRQRTALAKVDAFKSTARGAALTIRCCLTTTKVAGLTSAFVPGAGVEVGKLFSMTTLHRTYEALRALRFFDMRTSILKAKTASKGQPDEDDVRSAVEDYGVNQPQAEAIVDAIASSQGFHLIQGPPGTGKTKTICSLVAHFIRNRKAPAVPIQPSSAASKGMLPPVKRKILLCAPSNAAVDEVTKRVHMGFELAGGQHIKPNVVRVGRAEALNVAVKECSLEEIVDRRLASSAAVSNQTTDPAQVLTEIRAIRDQMNSKQAELDGLRGGSESSKVVAQLEAELNNLRAKHRAHQEKLDAARDARQTVNRQHDADRKRAQLQVLLDADVICATLSGAGHPVMSQLPFDFETVVIDEAAQASELEALIPLRYGCQRCILVGDPKQLPPTVKSREAERARYAQSLFLRLFNEPGNHVSLLSIQYRMHPTISRFPSEAFYDGRLADGPNMQRLTQRPWHRDRLLQPFALFNSSQGFEESGRGHSLINRGEAQLTAAIYDRVRRFVAQSQVTTKPGFTLAGNVGVVTMYKNQLYEIKRVFRQIYGEGIENEVDFNTVDGFQGQEKDVIILSCVRSRGIGFLSDFRRINVAITRAKSNLFIVANVQNLEANDRGGEASFWRKLIQIAREGGNLQTVTQDMFRAPFTAAQGAQQGTFAIGAAPEVTMREANASLPVTDGFSRTGNTPTKPKAMQDATLTSASKKRPASVGTEDSSTTSSCAPVDPKRFRTVEVPKSNRTSSSTATHPPSARSTVSHIPERSIERAPAAYTSSYTLDHARPPFQAQPPSNGPHPRGLPPPRPPIQSLSVSKHVGQERSLAVGGSGGRPAAVPIAMPGAAVTPAAHPSRPTPIVVRPQGASGGGPSYGAANSLFIPKSRKQQGRRGR